MQDRNKRRTRAADAPCAQGKPPEKQAAQKLEAEETAPERKPSLVSRILKSIGLGVLVILALVFVYIFLLLGEPDDDVKYLPEKPAEESVTMPMTALDMPGESDPQKLADTFGQPVLVLEGALSMYKARMYDTAFDGEYARCVTVTYAFEDGAQLTVQSIRPTAAVSLIKQQDYRLDGSALYTMAGLTAARMQNDTSVCVFAQSDTAVYAITCPASHADQLPDLLRYTTLAAPIAAN